MIFLIERNQFLQYNQADLSPDHDRELIERNQFLQYNQA